MTVIKRTLGKGIGAWTVITRWIATSEGIDEDIKLLREHWSKWDVGEVLDNLEKEAVAVLKKARLRPVGLPNAEGIEPADGPEGYAARVLWRLGQLKSFRRRATDETSKDYVRRWATDRALEEAMRLGMLLREQEIKREWGRFALGGKASHDGAHANRRSTAMRDIGLARKYQAMRAMAKYRRKSDTELKRIVGETAGIKGERARVKAVDRGLRLIKK